MCTRSHPIISEGEANSVASPPKTATPATGREQMEIPVWAVGIQRALERLVDLTSKNVGRNRNPEVSQNQNLDRSPERNH